MTQEQRVQAVVDFGFTDRQARFLVLVLRHAGVCIPRQYSSFSGIANGGRRCNAFFDRLVRRGYANDNGCVHNRARLYHLRHKPLYHVIGDTVRPAPSTSAPFSASAITRSRKSVYDLKAVNPHRKAEVDQRTPAELLDLVEAKGREVAEALAALRVLTNPR